MDHQIPLQIVRSVGIGNLVVSFLTVGVFNCTKEKIIQYVHAKVIDQVTYYVTIAVLHAKHWITIHFFTMFTASPAAWFAALYAAKISRYMRSR